jgi:TonB family protein
MSKDSRFWRNVTLIGVAHVAVIYGLVRWNRETKAANSQSILWLNGGGGDGAASATQTGFTPKKLNAATSTPEPKPPQTNESDDDRPVLTSAKSDIQLPTPRPSASPTSKAGPTAVAKVTPKPTPKPTAKPTPKPTIKPKPKPTPKKTILAKVSPKPSPKIKRTPEGSEDKDEQADPDADKKDDVPKIPVATTDNHQDDVAAKKTAVAPSGGGKGTSVGAGGHAGGGEGESQFGWYGSMLHDRFYSEWIQPSTVASSKAKTSVLVKIRIEKDGRVSSFETIKPSGNSAIDESVAAIGKRVTQVDPLPAGLGNGEHYDVKINFELNSEQ